jgi:hypothetical protein
MLSWDKYIDRIYVISSSGRDQEEARVLHDLEETLINPGITVVRPQTIAGHVQYKGILIPAKKLSLLKGWRAILNLEIENAGMNDRHNVMILEDDIRLLDNLAHLPLVMEQSNINEDDSDINMLALGAKDVFTHTNPPKTFPIPLTRFNLIRSQWTGNLCNILTAWGITHFDKWIPHDEELQLKMFKKHKALDLTWSTWPDVYRLEKPMVSHAPIGVNDE